MDEMPEWYTWNPEQHLLGFFGIKAVLFWQYPSLSTILRPVIEDLGEAYYYLLVAFEASKGTEEDYHTMVTQLGSTLEEGLQKWGDVVATAGWGQMHIRSIAYDTQTATVLVEDPWELTIYRTDDVKNNLPFLCGKLSGIFTHAFGRTMRAKVVAILETGQWPQAEIELAPSDATLLSELEELMQRDGFTRQERLQFANHQLRERTQELARANSLLRIARNDAETLRRVAEDANAAKSRLIASMSHELRTPLNAILGFSEIIRDQLFGPNAGDRYRSYAEDIYNSGTHLLELIGDLLDLAKVEAGQFDFIFEDLDAFEVVSRCLRFVAPAASGRSIDLQIREVAKPAPRLRADSRALRQMVLNLLSNAIKFTPEHGTVGVSVLQGEDGSVSIAVSDTGLGLSEDEQRRIFEPFTRGSYAIASQAEGVGLGLSLVRSMMARHGGTVSVQSTRGEGTTFILRFPPPGFVKRRPRMRRETLFAALQDERQSGDERA